MIVLAIHWYNIEDTGKTQTSCKFVWKQDVPQVQANNNLSGVFLSWLRVLLTAFQRLSEIGSADRGRTPRCYTHATLQDSTYEVQPQRSPNACISPGGERTTPTATKHCIK
jgi:hypothetical protein